MEREARHQQLRIGAVAFAFGRVRLPNMIQTSLPELSMKDRPRSMRDPIVQQQRQAMLALPHIAPLTAYAAELGQRANVQVPNFDPLDGGVNAQALFLFEKPGPMTAVSGFISRNNDDPTAEAIFKFMEQANIPRKLTVIWNIIPWWNGMRKVTAKELKEGAATIDSLVKLLPALAVIVMVGRKAKKARRFLKNTGLELIDSYHPSPIVRATYPSKWGAIPSEWKQVLTRIQEV